MYNLFSFLSYFWSWNPKSTDLTKEQKRKYKQLQSIYEGDFVKDIVGFDTVMGRLINLLCFWTATGLGNVIVVSGDKEKTKRAVIKRVIRAWGEMNPKHQDQDSPTTVDCSYYHLHDHSPLLLANLVSEGVLWLQNVNPKADFVPLVFSQIGKDVQRGELLCIIELVPAYSFQTAENNLSGLPVGEWADFSTPDRATIEREIAEKWKSISDNALSEDDLSSIMDTVMEDGSCDNLLNILNSVAQSKQETPKKKKAKTEEDVINPPATDNCRVKNEKGNSVTIIQDSNVGNVIYSAPSCVGSDEATVGNVDYELSQVSNGSLHYSRQRQQAWAR